MVDLQSFQFEMEKKKKKKKEEKKKRKKKKKKKNDLPLAVTGSFFSCCPTKLGFSVVSSQGKCFLFGNTPTEEVVFTYITATVCRLSSIHLNPAFSYSAVDSSCQLVFVPKRCVCAGD